MQNFDFSLILTCSINPKNMPDLVRSDKDLRLSDYKKSFQFWVNHEQIKKIIMIENTGYDLEYFRKIASKFTDKETEIISSSSNETFDKKLGKGYGQYLCLKEIFEKSLIVKNTNFFIDITGRHIVKNFKKLLNEIINEKPDIYLNLTDNLKFADTNIYGGTKTFFEKYVIPETQKTDDRKNNIFEKCVAKATLKALANGLVLSSIPTYAEIEGYIGTNGKRYKQNLFKKMKLSLYKKCKNYFFNHKKY